MSFRARLRRLRRAAEGETVMIPQPDGTAARFPEGALCEAWLTNVRRASGEDVPEHPLTAAAHRSGNPDAWLGTLCDGREAFGAVEDLSE